MMQPETIAVSSVYEGRDALIWGESVLRILKRPSSPPVVAKVNGQSFGRRNVGRSSPGSRTYRFKEHGMKPESMHETIGFERWLKPSEPQVTSGDQPISPVVSMDC